MELTFRSSKLQDHSAEMVPSISCRRAIHTMRISGGQFRVAHELAGKTGNTKRVPQTCRRGPASAVFFSRTLVFADAFSLACCPLLSYGKPPSSLERKHQGEPNSVPVFLKMLDPKLAKQFALAHQVFLCQAHARTFITLCSRCIEPWARLGPA